ncbi:MAG: diguanylate cyclase [Candidatus Omnitrophica bacterium]|nr:diguanylate cyclase [Candidatus Omnitrophota bacterium]
MISLLRLLASGAVASSEILHTLALLMLSLAVYSWVLYPFIWNVVISVLAGALLLWVWAVRQTAILGVELTAFAVLLIAAGWQRRLRDRRTQQMQQRLEDVREEQTVQEQAIALARQAHDALQKKLARYAQLQIIAEELSNMTELNSIARLAVTRALALIGKSDVCLLFLLDAERQELSLVASEKHQTMTSIRAKHGDQFDRYVLRTHRPLLVNDIRRDFRFTVTVSTERTINSVIACPLLLDQNPEGVLRLDSAQAGAYTQDDLRLLDILLDLVSTAVMNAKLFAQTQHLAMTDGLTGLTLRRPFLEQLAREITRSGRSREPVSVLMLDVDHFKAYNDQFGHSAGDVVLKSVAEVLKAVVPSEGVSARYGGEEFAVLLPRMARPQANDAAETIRRLVETQVRSERHGDWQAATPLSDEMAASGHDVQARSERASPKEPSRRRRVEAVGGVTVSIGVAAFPDDAQADVELVRVADQRLYQAKRAGRNLVCCS